MGKSIPFETHHIQFLKDPKHAKAYLDVAWEEYEQDGNLDILQLAFQDVIKAQKKIAGF
jgi:hypothetical protein